MSSKSEIKIYFENEKLSKENVKHEVDDVTEKQFLEIFLSVTLSIIALVLLKENYFEILKSKYQDSVVEYLNLPFLKQVVTVSVYGILLYVLKSMQFTRALLFSLTNKKERLFFFNYILKVVFNKIVVILVSVIGILGKVFFDKFKMTLIARIGYVVSFLLSLVIQIETGELVFLFLFSFTSVVLSYVIISILFKIVFEIENYFHIRTENRKLNKFELLRAFISDHIKFFNSTSSDDGGLLVRGFSVYIILCFLKSLFWLSDRIKQIEVLNKGIMILFNIYQSLEKYLLLSLVNSLRFFRILAEALVSILITYYLKEAIMILFESPNTQVLTHLGIISLLVLLSGLSRNLAYVSRVKMLSKQRADYFKSKEVRKIGLVG